MIRKPPMKKNHPIFTEWVFLLWLLTIGIMFYLYLTHRNITEDQGWVQYTLYMIGFAAIGWIGTQVIYQQPILPARDQFKKLELDTGIRTGVILIVSMISQFIVQSALTFTITEKALYYVFAAVAEELFFRVFLLSMFLKFKENTMTQFGAILLQAIFFTAIHQNYYDNFPMLVSVFVGGILLGVFYVIWRDPTANILAHFLLNVIAVRNLLFELGSSGEHNMYLFIIISLAVLGLIFYQIKTRKNPNESNH